MSCSVRVSSSFLFYFEKCMSRKGDWYTSYDEVPQNLQTQLKQSMFPPGEELTKKLKINHW